MAAKDRIIKFPNAAKIYGGRDGIIAEVMEITPADASAWLRANHNNRPVRKRHVEFLAREILEGNWQVNGQAIVIAEDEQVLDGQHRLFAVIEAGKPIKTMVVYGIAPEAFKTIDTGAVRSSADALFLELKDMPNHTIKAVAVAAQLCNQLDRGAFNSRFRLSNTDVIEYCKQHNSLFDCANTVLAYPRDARPLAVGAGTGLYEMFQRKNKEKAEQFMRRFFTGEELTRTDPEYLLRAAFLKNADALRQLSMQTRIRMVIKGWNWVRRGNTEANRQTIALQPNEDPKIKIF